MRETSVEKSVVKWARARGIEAIKLDCHLNVGIPDRLFLIPGGKPLFMELKRPGDKDYGLREIQRFRIKQLESKGYDCVVCDNKDAAIVHLERRLGTTSVSG